MPSLHLLTIGLTIASAACFPGPIDLNETDVEDVSPTTTEVATPTDVSVDTTTELEVDASDECDDEDDCAHLATQCVSVACVDHRCKSAPKSGSSCDDGEPCTIDICTDGVCTPLEQKACDAPAACQRLPGACDEVTGACIYDSQVDGAACTLSGDEPGVCDTGACTKLPKLFLGLSHACVVFGDGELHCWGSNTLGELGLGHTETVAGDGGLDIASSSKVDVEAVLGGFAGNYHTCIFVGGGMKCWGWAEFGRLGYADDVSTGTTPDTVPALLDLVPFGATPRQGETYSYHSCAVTSDSKVRCWGRGGPSLGYPGLIQVAGAGYDTCDVVGDVDVRFDVAQVSVGPDRTCARATSGDVRCWGEKHLGFEFSGTIGDDETPGSVPVINVGWEAIDLSVAAEHNCVVSKAHEVWCWGAGTGLGLGQGRESAVQITPAKVPVGFEVVAVATGNSSTCALSAIGTVRCWGQGAVLGHETAELIGVFPGDPPSNHPAIELGGAVHQLAVRGTFACVVTRSGGIRCWGNGGGAYPRSDGIGDEAGEMPPPEIPFEH